MATVQVINGIRTIIGSLAVGFSERFTQGTLANEFFIGEPIGGSLVDPPAIPPGNWDTKGGNDTFVASGGEDTIDGGDRIQKGGSQLDCVDYSAWLRPIAANLSQEVALDTPYVDPFGVQVALIGLVWKGTGFDYFVSDLGENAVLGRPALSSIECILGSRFNDTIEGSAKANRLVGNAGNDLIKGLAGNDTLEGGAGNDTLEGGTGQDSIRGGAGRDSILGDEGNDTIFGEGEGDRIDGGDGNDSIDGGLANDTVLGGAGRDTILGNDGNDSINGGDGPDSALGGAGNDTIVGGNFLDFSADTLLGEAGNDLIFGSAGGDSLSGGVGADTVFGQGGADSIDGGADNDSLDGGDAADTVYGQGGDDFLSGGAGDDCLYGDGPDALPADSKNDTLCGGDGNDCMEGELGNDVLYGQQLDDALNGGDGDDSLFGGSGNDQIFTGNGADYVNGGAGEDNIFAGNDNAPDYFYFGCNSYEPQQTRVFYDIIYDLERCDPSDGPVLGCIFDKVDVSGIAVALGLDYQLACVSEEDCYDIDDSFCGGPGTPAPAFTGANVRPGVLACLFDALLTDEFYPFGALQLLSNVDADFDGVKDDSVLRAVSPTGGVYEIRFVDAWDVHWLDANDPVNPFILVA